MTEVEWRPLPDDYGPYEVSNEGLVRNSNGRVLKPEASRTGHLRVQLYVTPGNPKHFSVHRLVARAFIGASELDVLHWDDDPKNNHISNLRYGTDKENWWDGARNGRRRVSDYCLRGHPYTFIRGRVLRKRCFICESDTDRKRYFERMSQGISAGDSRHGSYSGYRAGCRCTECLGANRDYKREWASINRERKRNG